MPESSSTTGMRPGAPSYEPVVRLGAPLAPPLVSGVSVPSTQPNHGLLLPEADSEDDASPLPTRPTMKTQWYAYLGSGLSGAVVVAAIYGLLGLRSPVSGNRPADRDVGTAVHANDTTAFDRRADTLALTIEAFALRGRMFDSRRMGCAGLARGLQQVEDGWLQYNLARKGMLALSNAARDARDRALYADVRAVEVRFERSSCNRP
jgi:hypothetical protein